MMQNEGIINLTAVDAPPSVEVTLPGIIGIIIKLVAHHASLASGTYHDIPLHTKLRLNRRLFRRSLSSLPPAEKHRP